MRPLAHARRDRRRGLQCGITLVDALIALLVLAFGMLAFASLQGRLRQHADTARQRSEAVRLAQAHLEELRAFGRLRADPAAVGASYEEIVDSTTPSDAAAGGAPAAGPTHYALNRRVVEDRGARTKDLTLTVRWSDRGGASQSIVLRTIIGASDPMLAARLPIPVSETLAQRPGGRHAQIPWEARDLGNGRSLLESDAHDRIALEFDNASGAVTRECRAPPSDPPASGRRDEAPEGFDCVDVARRLPHSR